MTERGENFSYRFPDVYLPPPLTLAQDVGWRQTVTYAVTGREIERCHRKFGCEDISRIPLAIFDENTMEFAPHLVGFRWMFGTIACFSAIAALIMAAFGPREHIGRQPHPYWEIASTLAFAVVGAYFFSVTSGRCGGVMFGCAFAARIVFSVIFSATIRHRKPWMISVDKPLPHVGNRLFGNTGKFGA